MAGLKSVCRLAITGGTPQRALAVAAVVGTILNLINQGDAIFGPAAVNGFKLALTYCVPYGVCTYGAVTAKRAALTSVPARFGSTA
jgi:hypothetical protein